MKKTIQIISILVCVIMLVWVTPISVQAETTSVDDCLKDNANCEFQEETNADGEGNQLNSQVTSSDTGNMFVNFLKLILALGLVLALIYLLLKLVNRKNKLFQRHHTLENMGGITLGPQKSMQVVRIGNQYYVVGVGDNVELLTEITDKKTIDELLAKEANAEFSTTSLIQSLTGKKSEKNSAEGRGKEDFASIFSKELNTFTSGRKQTFAKYLNKGERENE